MNASRSALEYGYQILGSANKAAIKEYTAAKAEYDQIPPKAKEALKKCIKGNFPDVYKDDQIDFIVEEWMQIEAYHYLTKKQKTSDLLKKSGIV